VIHARSHVPAAIGLAARRHGARLLFDVRGLLADEYADIGHWRVGDARYRVTKAVERLLFRRADALVMLTETIKGQLVATEPALRHRADDITVIPCCVDTAVFRRDEEARVAMRRERGWTGRRVLVYVGKLGGWYLDDVMAEFFATARRADPDCFLQVLSQSEPGPFAQTLRAAGVPEGSFDIRFAVPADVPRWLGAADGGLSFIRPCYSKRASSPTKVAEYLAMGLTVVSTKGIGDCDAILAEPGLGVTVDLDRTSYADAYGTLRALWDDPATPRTCRGYAERELSLDAVGVPRYVALYERLCGARLAVTSLA
jgi:glycosyltransferase involved in cell wall biosynthesis